MKRAATYILTFFLICFLLGSLSKSITDKIYFSYSPKVVDEISNRLAKQNETLNLDGKIVEAYLIATGGTKIVLDGKLMNWYDLKNNFNSNRYSAKINNENLEIKTLSNGSNSTLSTLQSVNSIIIIKNISMNILVILSGLLLNCLYNLKNKKKYKDKMVEQFV